nr:pentatricopeptide repeat-containing protein, mitochondrial [Quercus suber]
MILDTAAYSLIVHAKVKLGNLESAWKVSTLPKEGDGRSGFEVYSECFDLIIEGCAKAGKLEESLMHCEKILERRLVPSCWAFNEMVGKLSEIGNVEQANAMLTILLDRGFLPDEITYSSD